MTGIRFQDPDASVEAVYGIDPLRAPLKTVRHVFGHDDYLGPAEKLSLLPMVAPALLAFEHLRDAHDGETVAQWWWRSNGNATVMERFVRPFCRGIQFTEPEEISAFNLLGWIHHVMRHPAHTLVAGYHGPRDGTIFAPFGRYLTDRGATIRVGAKLEEIAYHGAGASGRVDAFRFGDGERVEADAFVAAMPVWALVPQLPSPLRPVPFHPSAVRDRPRGGPCRGGRRLVGPADGAEDRERDGHQTQNQTNRVNRPAATTHDRPPFVPALQRFNKQAIPSDHGRRGGFRGSTRGFLRTGPRALRERP